MELALPHVVVWTTGPGLGTDLVAALAAHPVEVSEIRGLVEAERAATSRPPLLVVLVSPQDVSGRIAVAARIFPGVPILLYTSSPTPLAAAEKPAGVVFEEHSTDQPISEICWQVTELLSRTIRTFQTPERRLGPMRIELDRMGVVGGEFDLRGIWFFPGPYPRAGESLLKLLQPEDRGLFTRYLELAGEGAVSFFPVRVLDDAGASHPMHAGLRFAGAGRVDLILQPLIDCAPIVGRRRGTRDPLTGLIDRWELWRQMGQRGASAGPACVLVAKLDAFESIATTMNFQQVDEVFDRVASAITRVFPWPAQPSRLTGGAFLCLITDTAAERLRTRAQRLIQLVNRIGGEGVFDELRFGLSIGIADVTDGDHDLAVRLAETAVREAHTAGGNRVVIAGSDTLIHLRVGDLQENMDLDSWELWLQPVVRGTDGKPDFHEALARFGTAPKPKITRPDFFTAGQLAGLLERFDRLVLLRSLELLTAHPQLRLSVNVTRETFATQSFPEAVIAMVRDSQVDPSRIIIEISPVCLTLPEDHVRPRLQRLEDDGIAVALDDFGSGVCSLRHLTDFPIAMVKLDELVTSYVADDPLQRNFVRMLVNLCRARGIRTVAEWTRTIEQMQRLAEDGIDLFQGELLGMPMPPNEVLPQARPPSTPSKTHA
jgi:EAL domain-containing protein (putative c-di-GMP-specific phosphodiesterase class I)/GGDEF domain-containing protein